jgi:hypothetical protein
MREIWLSGSMSEDTVVGYQNPAWTFYRDDKASSQCIGRPELLAQLFPQLNHRHLQAMPQARGEAALTDAP